VANVPPFWCWPSYKHLTKAFALGATLVLWWAVLFFGANWVTSLHSFRLRINLDAEEAVPYVPQAVLGYLSIYLLSLITPFVLRTDSELHALGETCMAVTFFAAIAFVLIPAEHTNPHPAGDGAWSVLVMFTKQAALPHNMVPSLHVALTVVFISALASHAGWLGQCLLWIWATVISLSTLLLHQHYLLDVATGFVLGRASIAFIYRKQARGPNTVRFAAVPLFAEKFS